MYDPEKYKEFVEDKECVVRDCYKARYSKVSKKDGKKRKAIVIMPCPSFGSDGFEDMKEYFACSPDMEKVREEYDLIICNQIGFGGSEILDETKAKDQSEYFYGNLAGVWSDVIEKEDIDMEIAVGHSAGGAFMARLAEYQLKHGKKIPKKVVMFNTALDKKYLPFLKALPPKLMEEYSEKSDTKMRKMLEYAIRGKKKSLTWVKWREFFDNLYNLKPEIPWTTWDHTFGGGRGKNMTDRTRDSYVDIISHTYTNDILRLSLNAVGENLRGHCAGFTEALYDRIRGFVGVGDEEGMIDDLESLRDAGIEIVYVKARGDSNVNSTFKKHEKRLNDIMTVIKTAGTHMDFIENQEKALRSITGKKIKDLYLIVTA